MKTNINDIDSDLNNYSFDTQCLISELIKNESNKQQVLTELIKFNEKLYNISKINK
jgi:hypothetical protein